MKRRELLKLAVASVVAPSALKDKPKAERAIYGGKVVFDSNGYGTTGIGSRFERINNA